MKGIAAAALLGLWVGAMPLASGRIAASAAQPAETAADALSPASRRLLAQVLRTRDNGGKPFMIVDKVNASVLVFEANGALRAHAPVLLGAARGDDSVPGIGERPIKDIRPHERTTPAGRFIAEAGRNTAGEDIVWVDYDAAVSMHRVRATNPAERRLQRLATPGVHDNRISYGCINVPAKFFDRYVGPLAVVGPVVYVLPEVRSPSEVFGARLDPAHTDQAAATAARSPLR